jgi:hypothetical protein
MATLRAAAGFSPLHRADVHQEPIDPLLGLARLARELLGFGQHAGGAAAGFRRRAGAPLMFRETSRVDADCRSTAIEISDLTSEATIAKPSPARTASMVALSASRLV